jgi:ATP-dependent Lon protease
MGTSAQWASSRESVPLQLIKRVGLASVGVIWDEIEKTGTRRENGHAGDALLPMLEPDQAKRLRDLALEVEVDLSAVSHFATANSLEGVPKPLLDRMRIITMPDPTWQHLGTLTRQILDRLAAERGLDPRWHESLAEDELDLVRANWPGGSIRQLTTIVRAIADGRQHFLGRC